MKKISPIPVLLIITISITLILSACSQTTPDQDQIQALPQNDTPIDVYAVLAEKDNYADVDMSNLLVDYIDIKRIRGALEELGWPPENIHDLKEFDRESLLTELDWLEEVADSNDIVLFYVTGHGNYLRYRVHWNDFFPEEWSQIASQQRVLVVDSCSAAEFTNSVNDDPSGHISIAAVDGDEYGWKGIKEEGLPIIGGVFTFYFAEALGETKADRDGNGLVSVQEAALFAEEKQRGYMHDVVFAVPQFVEDYHSLGARSDEDETFPDVIIDDGLGYPLDLSVTTK